MTFEEAVQRLGGERQKDGSYLAHCPSHPDAKPSLHISRAGDGRALLHDFGGCTHQQIVTAINNGASSPPAQPPPSGKPTRARCVATYEYRDADGVLRYREQRFEDDTGRKSFRASRPDEHGGWIWNLKGVTPLPYRLPELLASADRVAFIVEGAKCAEALRDLGYVATTHHGGAGNAAVWKHLAPHLKNRNIVVLPDNDTPGEKCAAVVCQHVAKSASKLRLLRLPDLPEAGDIVDWLGAGHTREELQALVRACQEWRSEPAWEPPTPRAAPPPPDIDARPANKAVAASVGGRCSQATVLVTLAESANVEWFHDGDDAFARCLIDEHHATYRVRSREFRLWLGRLYYTQTHKAPSGEALGSALALCESRARFDGKQHRVYTRVGEHEGNIFLDLCDEHWRVVEITSSDWRVVGNSPVRFRRARGMLALPEPVAGGRLDELRTVVNVASDDDFLLLMKWLISTLRPWGPYPVLEVHGEQGTTKSTLCRFIRMITDPNVAALRAEPRDERDLIIAATNARIIALDNVSYLQPWLSDALCRLATGGGFSARELYSDADEILFNVQRPVVLNGITEVAIRADLLDRSLLIEAPRIEDRKRRTEADLNRTFDAAHPRLLGALLDAVVTALAHVTNVRLDRLPRMADFAVWAVAADPEHREEFLRAYAGNRAGANETAIESSEIGRHVLALIEAERGTWTGNATDLLEELNKRANDATRRQRGWPQKPHVLTGALKRIAPNLRAIGVAVEFRRSNSERGVTLSRISPESSVTNVTSVIPCEKASAFSDGAGDADNAAPPLPVTGNPLPALGGDAGDAGDDELQPSSEVIEL